MAYIEYYFRIGDNNFYIGRFETKEPQTIGFQDRFIGSIWELVNDLRTEKPERFEHECIDLEWRSLQKLIPENNTADCPYCEIPYGEVDEWPEKKEDRWWTLETHGTSECPNGSHRCILSLPVYVCNGEGFHSFTWLGRFIDLNKQQALRQTMGKYGWDV